MGEKSIENKSKSPKRNLPKTKSPKRTQSTQSTQSTSPTPPSTTKKQMAAKEKTITVAKQGRSVAHTAGNSKNRSTTTVSKQSTPPRSHVKKSEVPKMLNKSPFQKNKPQQQQQKQQKQQQQPRQKPQPRL